MLVCFHRPMCKTEIVHSSTFPFVIQLAEYRQRKAHADSQRKQKKKKKKKEEESQGTVEVEQDHSGGIEEVSFGGRDGSQEGDNDLPTTEFTFAKTLQSGETVKHNQTYTIEVGPRTRPNIYWYLCCPGAL